jgi:1-acyl-sn-glycerol-3-phosphate acyltransferase
VTASRATCDVLRTTCDNVLRATCDDVLGATCDVRATPGVAERPRLVSPARHGSRSRRARAIALAIASGVIVSAVAIALVPIGITTLFRARRLYAFVACVTSRLVLRLYGIRIRVLSNGSLWDLGLAEARLPSARRRGQTVYVSNHTSTLDLFVLVALGLPNCRFFLSGFVRKFVPLGVIGWMMGTFFTVPQSRPAERTRIFQRAERILRRTGESVYLSPEGGRITTGEIGHFNKGAFHLATHLRVPIVPFYISIPPDVDPGRGYDAAAGFVDVHVLPAIDTTAWTVNELDDNRQRVRELFVRFHAGITARRNTRGSNP